MKISNIIDKNIAVHCNTKGKAEKIFYYCESMGLNWCNDKHFLFNSHWFDYKNETCYSIEEGNLKYSGRQQYVNAGYKIIEFEELELEGLNMKIKDLTENKIAIHCNTKEKIDMFLVNLERQDYHWIKEVIETMPYIKNAYELHKESFCIAIWKKQIWCEYLEWFIRKGYQIVKFEDLKLEN